MRGYLAADESAAGRRPGVLVFHEGPGLGEFAMARAKMLAELGYVALAADMFGDRRQARNLQEGATIVGGLRAAPGKLPSRRWRPPWPPCPPSRKNSAPAAARRLPRSQSCRRSMRPDWRRSAFVSA